MITKRRRRLGWFVLVVIALGCGGVAAGASAVADSERVADMFVLAEVGGVPGGAPGAAAATARVTEVIDYEFGVEQRHGIFRDVPDIPLTVEPTIFSPTAPDQFVVESSFGATRFRIGDPNATINGRHRYDIRYPLSAAVQESRFSFDAVGTDWEVTIDGVEIHVVSQFELDGVTCDKGSRGDRGGCDAIEVEPGHLVVTLDKIDTGNGVTISADLGAPLASPPTLPEVPSGPVSDPGVGLVKPALATALAILLGALPAVALARRLGREQAAVGGAADVAFADHASRTPGQVELADAADLSQLATVDFAPPAGVTAAQGGVILEERVTSDHSTAWLLNQAIFGSIGLEEVDDKPVIRATEVRAPLADDQTILNAMLGGRSEVKLDKYDATFAAGWAKVGASLETWMEASPLWCSQARARRSKFVGLAVLALILGGLIGIGGAAMAGRYGGPWLAVCVVGSFAGGAAIGMLVRSWELMVRTPAGTAVWLRLLSFKRFLADSEAEHVEWAAQHGMLREYTAWAVALDEARHWAHAVKHSNVDTTGVGAYDAVRFAHIGPSLSRAVSTASTAPSSSGGGGGGVGGGGGGGGGGSW